MMQEIAKLYAVKPVLGKNKTAFLKDLGFVKEGTQWVKYGTKQELQELWDEIDVYKDIGGKWVTKEFPKKDGYSDAYYNKKYPVKNHYWNKYRVDFRFFNDAEIDFYLEVERVEDAAVAAQEGRRMPKIKFEVITTKVDTFVVDGYSDNEVFDLQEDEHVQSLWLSDYNRGSYNQFEIRSSNHQQINFIEVVVDEEE